LKSTNFSFDFCTTASVPSVSELSSKTSSAVVIFEILCFVVVTFARAASTS
jgi:hypothetical protein